MLKFQILSIKVDFRFTKTFAIQILLLMEVTLLLIVLLSKGNLQSTFGKIMFVRLKTNLWQIRTLEAVANQCRVTSTLKTFHRCFGSLLFVQSIHHRTNSSE